MSLAVTNNSTKVASKVSTDVMDAFVAAVPQLTLMNQSMRRLCWSGSDTLQIRVKLLPADTTLELLRTWQVRPEPFSEISNVGGGGRSVGASARVKRQLL